MLFYLIIIGREPLRD